MKYRSTESSNVLIVAKSQHNDKLLIQITSGPLTPKHDRQTFRKCFNTLSYPSILLKMSLLPTLWFSTADTAISLAFVSSTKSQSPAALHKILFKGLESCSFNLCVGAARIVNWYEPNLKSNPPKKTPRTAKIARRRELLYSSTIFGYCEYQIMPQVLDFTGAHYDLFIQREVRWMNLA